MTCFSQNAHGDSPGIKAVIFDLDGHFYGCAHSQLAECFLHAALKVLFGETVTVTEVLKTIATQSFKEHGSQLVGLAQHMKIELTSELKDEYQFAATEQISRVMVTNPEIPSILQELQSHKITLAILTHSTQAGARKMLEHLKISQFFPDTLFAIDHPLLERLPRKDQGPDMLLRVLKHLNVAREQAFFGDDTLINIEHARRADITHAYHLEGPYKLAACLRQVFQKKLAA